MRLFVNGALVLFAFLVAGTAQAQPAIGVGGGDCGSPNLSTSVGRKFVIQPGRPCLSFMNDVGRVAGLTLDTSVAFPRLRVMPESALRSIRLSRDAHRVRIFDGVVSAAEIAIRIQPLDAPVTLTLHAIERAPGSHARGAPVSPPPAAQRAFAASERSSAE